MEPTPQLEVFRAATPPGLVPHGPFIEAAYIRGNMGGLVLVKLRAGDIPPHSHEQEHVGVVLEGAFEFYNEQGVTRLRAGDGYRIPPNLPHGIRCDDYALIVQARAG